MNYSPSDIAQAIELRRGIAIDRGDIAYKLSSRSMDDDMALIAPRLRYEIWDKKSPINGVDAPTIKTRSDYVGGEVYLIYVDEQLKFLQPHDPTVQGYVAMTPENVDYRAQQHVHDLVTTMAMDQVIIWLEETMAPAPPTAPPLIITAPPAQDLPPGTPPPMMTAENALVYEPEYIRWKERQGRKYRSNRG